MLELPIAGHGLVLREFIEDDVSAVTRIASTAGFSFYAFVPSSSPDAEIEQSAREFVARMISLRAIDPKTGKREHYKLVIADAADPEQKMIGYVAMDDVSSETQRDIGYFVDPQAHGCGIATKACKLVVDAFFAATDFDHIHATVHPENTPSIRVLGKLGYRQVGATTKTVSGVEEPRLVLTMTRSDFYMVSPLSKRTPDMTANVMAAVSLPPAEQAYV